LMCCWVSCCCCPIQYQLLVRTLCSYPIYQCQIHCRPANPLRTGRIAMLSVLVFLAVIVGDAKPSVLPDEPNACFGVEINVSRGSVCDIGCCDQQQRRTVLRVITNDNISLHLLFYCGYA
jgi:hypothetical protein